MFYNFRIPFGITSISPKFSAKWLSARGGEPCRISSSTCVLEAYGLYTHTQGGSQFFSYFAS